MRVQTCKFLINTLNETAKQNKMSVTPKINSKYISNLKKSEFNPFTGEIILNKIFNSNNKILKPIVKKSIQHNIKHAEQFQIIARYFAGIAQNIDNGLNNFKELILKKFPMYKNEKFNDKFYKQTIAKDGVIKKGHPLFEKAKEYVKALRQYPDMSPFNDLEVLSEKGVKEMFKNKWHKKKLYKSNFLEKEARMAEKQK